MYIPSEQIWMVVVGFLVAFVLAFGIGANDVANTFGSSVGSGVLTLKQACTLATIFELSGAILLGSKVSSTVRKGIVETTLFETLDNGPATLMAGQVAALGGSCIWMLVATFFRLPVSGTHSIVGATMGFSLVVFGFRAINWMGVVKIVISWFVSPLLSGLVSVSIFVLIHYLVLTKDEPLEPALRLLPGFYGSMVVVNVVTILLGGSEALQFNKIPIYGIFLLGCGGGTITVILVKLFLLPYLRRRILAGENAGPSIADRMYMAFRCHRVAAFFHKVKCPRKLSSKTYDLQVHNKHMVKNEDTSEKEFPEVTFSSPNNFGKNDGDVGGDSRLSETVPLPQVTGNHQQSQIQNVYSAPPPAPPIGSVSQNRFIHTPFEVRPTESNISDAQNNGTRSNRQIIVFSAAAPEVGENTLSVTKRSVLAQPSLPAIGEEEPEGRDSVYDRPAEAKVFWFLQIMTSILGSFAHGGNDVSNAIGPLMGLWIVGVTQDVASKMANPYWILVYGGVGISVGLWIWGRRVIQTLGEDLTQITPSSGVCIELGSALTVLLASKLGLPVSTTHCQVGSVIFVGRFRSRSNVNWSIFRNIFIAWVVTVPVACAISALLMYLFTFAI
ncbi:hypothetical protein EG68_05175 [Paragonimus skrjabini miyazakii]|uniref:Phosphate transporter n=1 Tax=Paragonimus skrjabini miyazakii TaxID=59628 RepID=A0A8S9YQW8_9TREM|nr:hypothetical protein EG68_05175 [Paragonimus skrjabini miyazakii]